MGANNLLKYVGSMPDHCKFKAVASFGNPFDVWAAMNLMRDTGFEDYMANSTVQSYFLRKGSGDGGDFNERHLKETLDGDNIGMTPSEKVIMRQIIKGHNLDMPKLGKCKTWAQIDQELFSKMVVTPVEKMNEEAKKSKYTVSTSLAEYYNNLSCMDEIKNIKIPTLVVHSRDDPIIHYHCVPIDTCVANENFIVAMTNYGSHY